MTTITIGEPAKRSGVATSVVRFYEEESLIGSTRTQGGQRRYRREALRRVGFIRAARAVGLSLLEILSALEALPGQRTPMKEDWAHLARTAARDSQGRLEGLTALRDQLASCVSCGCLSLKSCSRYNPKDIAQRRGSGARYLLGDIPGGA